MKPCLFYIRTFYSLILIFNLSSCKKFVDIEPAPDLINTETLFNSDATATAAVNGVYVEMRASSPSMANGTLSVYNGLSADELNATSSDLEYDAFEQNSVLSTSEVVNYQLWNPAYRIIYRANIILENLQKSTALSLPIKNQLAGEMKMVRALYYFYLANFFGEVPLIISSDYRENESKSRSPVAEINQQVIKDLTEAGDLLIASYPSPGKLRPNKFTALALLSRVYLYQKDWPNAEAVSSLVISSGAYELPSTLSEVFKLNSAETIWEIAPANETINTAEGSLFIPATADELPVFCLSPNVLNAFEPGDQRKINWIGMNVVAGNSYYFPYKYKTLPYSPVEEYDIVLRLAEQYLIRAEARAHQDNIPGAAADVNSIRNRASLPNTTATEQASLLEAIGKERQVEFFTEWGHRWFDLKRTEQLDLVLSPLKGSNWQTTDSLFPVPFDEIRLNPFLVQNPGY